MEDTNKADSKLTLYLDTLKLDQFDDHNELVKISSVVFNLGGSYELFERYASRSEKYDENLCTKLWQSHQNIVNQTQPPDLVFDQLIRFRKLDTCEDFVQNNPHLHVFSEDIDSTCRKIFIASTYSHMFSLSVKSPSHFHEHFNGVQPVKLFLDIDAKIQEESMNNENDFNSNLKQSIDLVNEKLKDHNIDNPRVIILTSHRSTKLSAHVIYPDVVFGNIYQLKHFIESTSLIQNKTIDMAVYRNRGSFRLIWSYKFGTQIPLEFTEGINYTSKEKEQLFMDCLLTHIRPNIKIIHLEIPPKIKPNQNITNSNNSSLSKIIIPELSKYLDLLKVERCNQYEQWIRVGMILKCCNPDSFDLWDEWSKQSSLYENRARNLSIWSSFKTGYFSIASLQYYARQDNPEAYAKINTNIV